MEFMFPSVGKTHLYCAPGSRVWQDWEHILEYIADRINVPSLALRIYFARWRPGALAGFLIFEEEVSEYRRENSDLEFALIMQSYVDTIAPLQKLRGMKRFFVHLADPYDFSRAYYDVRNSGARFRRKKEMKALEARVGKLVVGKDHDPAANGKAEMPRSMWTYDPIRFHSLD